MKFCKILLIFCACTLISCNKTIQKPKDFDHFWEDAVLELDKTTSFEEIKDSIVGDKKWNLYKVKSYNDINFYTWVSEPLATGKFPIKIRFSGVSKENKNKSDIPNAWFLTEEHTINMLVDIRGQGLSTEQIKNENFITDGLDNNQTYIYKGAYLDAVKAVDFISINPKSDGNIIVTGGGQGGALSIAAAALNPKVTMCVIGFPFFTDIHNYDKKEWPMNIFMFYCVRHKIDFFELINTLSYFDMLYFADKINIPIFVRAQEKDNITPLEGVVKFYNQVKSDKKEIYIDLCEGHGCSSKSQKANALENLFIKNNMMSN